MNKSATKVELLPRLRFSEIRLCRQCKQKHPTWKAYREAHDNLARGCYERAAEARGLADHTAPAFFLHNVAKFIREDFETLFHSFRAPFDETMVDRMAENCAEEIVDGFLAHAGGKLTAHERKAVLASIAPGGAHYKSYRDCIRTTFEKPDAGNLAYQTAVLGADKYADEAGRLAVAHASIKEWQAIGLTTDVLEALNAEFASHGAEAIETTVAEGMARDFDKWRLKREIA